MKCPTCSSEADEGFKSCGKCREASRERSKEYYKNNREYSLNYARIYNIRHREQRHRWYIENRERCRLENRKRVKQWSENNKEHQAENVKRWIKEHPDAWKAIQHKRRARIKGNGGSFTGEELKELFEQQDGFCFYCGTLLYSSFDNDIHTDHKVPLSRGGTNDISNIALCCASCNRHKHTMTDVEFLKILNPTSNS
jgi:5-methylcytosine-specific restriction endonuclease McrA